MRLTTQAIERAGEHLPRARAVAMLDLLKSNEKKITAQLNVVIHVHSIGMRLKHEIKYGSSALEEKLWRGFLIYFRRN